MTGLELHDGQACEEIERTCGSVGAQSSSIINAGSVMLWATSLGISKMAMKY